MFFIIKAFLAFLLIRKVGVCCTKKSNMISYDELCQQMRTQLIGSVDRKDVLSEETITSDGKVVK